MRYPSLVLTNVTLPLPTGGVQVELAYLAACGLNSGLIPQGRKALLYLHKVKAPAWRGRLREHDRRDFEQQASRLAEALAAEIPERSYSALIVAPSSRPDLVWPFVQAVKKRFPRLYDLTPFCRRAGNARSGAGASFGTLMSVTHFDAPPRRRGDGPFLVVDDVFSTGTTSAVVMQLLRLAYGGDAEVVVACPLRMLIDEEPFKGPSIEELRTMLEPEGSAAPHTVTDDKPSDSEDSDENDREESVEADEPKPSETRITDDKMPRVFFSEVDIQNIAGDAGVRRIEVIDYQCRKSLNPPAYTETEVYADNPPGNHLVGESTERALSLWLVKQGIRHSRAESVAAELRDGAQDITTSPHGVHIDVKGSILYGNGRVQHYQVKSDPKLAVVWCLRVRPDYYDSAIHYDVSLPSEIKILGWSTMAEVNAVGPVAGSHEVSAGDMHDLSSLLEWITTGRCPV